MGHLMSLVHTLIEVSGASPVRDLIMGNDVVNRLLLKGALDNGQPANSESFKLPRNVEDASTLESNEL